MIILICTIAAIAIAFAVMLYLDGCSFIFSNFCISLLFGLLGAFIGLAIAIGITTNAESTPIVVDTYPVYAITDDYSLSEHTSGNVFLVTSSSDEKLKYNYLYNEDGKGLVFKSVNAEECYINTTTKEPYVEIIQYQINSPFLRWLMSGICFKQSYSFYLPMEAEIIHEYAIDLQ